MCLKLCAVELHRKLCCGRGAAPFRVWSIQRVYSALTRKSRGEHLLDGEELVMTVPALRNFAIYTFITASDFQAQAQYICVRTYISVK